MQNNDHLQNFQDNQQDIQKSHESGIGPVSLADKALAYFLGVLDDDSATATEKANAANRLAQIGREQEARANGAIHQMSRGELQAEIARVKSSLAQIEG